MPIDFTCPHCNHRLNVANEFAGQSGPCVRCGKHVTIPGNPTGEIAQSQPDLPTTSAFPNPYAEPVSGEVERPIGQNDAAIRMLIPVDRSGLAIAAGYLGLFSVLCLPAPIAVWVGVLAIRDIKANPTKHGLGRAWFGIIMGVLGTAMLGLSLLSMIWTA
jgi:hypothetical protein